MVAEPTRQCISVIDESEGTVTELVEESRPVGATDYESLEAIIRQQLPNCGAVIMSGSLTPGGPADFYKNITKQANKASILSVVDAQGPPLVEALQAKPGLVKPNRQELGATVQRSLKTESDVIQAMRQVREQGAGRVVVTAGTSPTLALSEEAIWRIQSPPVPAVNPIGSGDAFTAALVWRLVQADNLGEACRWGAAAGAANALSAMPGEVDRNNVEKLVGAIKVERL
jgi:1-phosphofructokinase family hexose kinase